MTDVPEQDYDPTDDVQRSTYAVAGGLKFATYRVRNPVAGAGDPDEWSGPQHHLTYGDTIMAMLDEDATRDLTELLAWIEENPKLVPESGVGYCQLKPTAEFYLSRRGKDQHLSIQIKRGRLILGVLGIESAKLFCRLSAPPETQEEAA